MKKNTRQNHLFIAAAMMVIALMTTTTPVSASGVDFLFGRKATPGTELHALGTRAMERNKGKATYFTNGKGRVLEVLSRQGKDGALRVSVNRTYIPKNYNGSRTAASLCYQLNHLAESSDAIKVGGYTLIDEETGETAHDYGTRVATALDRE